MITFQIALQVCMGLQIISGSDMWDDLEKGNQKMWDDIASRNKKMWDDVGKENQKIRDDVENEKLINQTKNEVTDLCGQFPVYSE